jgi:hypothetical protein
MAETKTFETWAIVEIMGHRQFAGFVSEQAIGGQSFVRVDVPAVTIQPSKPGDVADELPAFTKLFGAGSIYCISPCTEETARAFAAQSRARSFSVYEAPRLSAPASAKPDHDEWGGDEFEDDEVTGIDPGDDED